LSSQEKDLTKLSSLGHFLKGSSAILGVKQVEASCAKIEQYGKLRDHETNQDLNQEEALEKITRLLGQAKVEHKVAVKWLKKWYGDRGVTFEPQDAP
jgi:HPt (histidine-containing phosphotransfer) domain-containing protein